MKEVFKDIPGYESIYQASNFGNIRSLNRKMISSNNIIKRYKGQLMANVLDNTGYYLVNLTKYGKRRTRQVHQLMAMTFLNHKPNGHKIIVDHIDYNKLNNRLDNLQLVTQRENLTKDRHKHNRSSKYVGVSWHKPLNKWRASIKINSKNYYLGYFHKEIEASEAYQKRLKQLVNEIHNS